MCLRPSRHRLPFFFLRDVRPLLPAEPAPRDPSVRARPVPILTTEGDDRIERSNARTNRSEHTDILAPVSMSARAGRSSLRTRTTKSFLLEGRTSSRKDFQQEGLVEDVLHVPAPVYPNQVAPGHEGVQLVVSLPMSLIILRNGDRNQAVEHCTYVNMIVF